LAPATPTSNRGGGAAAKPADSRSSASRTPTDEANAEPSGPLGFDPYDAKSIIGQKKARNVAGKTPGSSLTLVPSSSVAGAGGPIDAPATTSAAQASQSLGLPSSVGPDSVGPSTPGMLNSLQ
jgi:hypothetical protein